MLEDKAKWVRKQVLEMIAKAGKGHIGGSFSCIEILTAIYYGDIFRQGQDKFILSKGHACAGLYAILADLGYFPISELDTFCQEGSRLEGHPHRGIPGIEVNSGSLGHGLGIGAGLALATELDNTDSKIVVLLGDGECHEGSTWEAIMFAGHHQLKNLIAIVDFNWQCTVDFIENCVTLKQFPLPWEAFGWETQVINGHNINQILRSLHYGYGRRSKKPYVIIANTVKGKGVSFMERNLVWHSKVPQGEKLEKARRELGY